MNREGVEWSVRPKRRETAGLALLCPKGSGPFPQSTLRTGFVGRDVKNTGREQSCADFFADAGGGWGIDHRVVRSLATASRHHDIDL